jgi:hypothetical protein
MKELKIFMLPDASVGTSTPESIVLRGTLAGDDKTPYTLTTDNRVRVNIKNYKDPKVQAVMKPLLGTVVEIGGSYIPPTPDITVTELAGKPIQ